MATLKSFFAKLNIWLLLEMLFFPCNWFIHFFVFVKFLLEASPFS